MIQRCFSLLTKWIFHFWDIRFFFCRFWFCENIWKKYKFLTEQGKDLLFCFPCLIDQIVQISVLDPPWGDLLEIVTRENERSLMAVLLKSSYSRISETMVFLTVSEVSFDGLLSFRIDLLPFIRMSHFFTFIQIVLPYVNGYRFLMIPWGSALT